MQNLNRFTRAGHDGRVIYCPVCAHSVRVFHFAWFALTCGPCQKMIDKNQWLTKGKT
jgi:ribosomal protein S27E